MPKKAKGRKRRYVPLDVPLTPKDRPISDLPAELAILTASKLPIRDLVHFRATNRQNAGVANTVINDRFRAWLKQSDPETREHFEVLPIGARIHILALLEDDPRRTPESFPVCAKAFFGERDGRNQLIGGCSGIGVLWPKCTKREHSVLDFDQRIQLIMPICPSCHQEESDSATPNPNVCGTCLNIEWKGDTLHYYDNIANEWETMSKKAYKGLEDDYDEWLNPRYDDDYDRYDEEDYWDRYRYD